MTWIELGEPLPRDDVLRYEVVIWPMGSCQQLSHPIQLPTASFASVTQERRSRRRFGPLSLDQVSQWLWLAMRVQQQSNGHDPGTSILTRRPTPSAGAIHPIDVFLQFKEGQDWQRYEPLDHALMTVPGSGQMLEDARLKANNIVPIGEGATVLLVAEPGKSLAKYEHAASLVWRDAGVLLGYLTMSAQAVGLNMCLLGCTGQPSVKNLDQQGRLVGVGMAVLGAAL